MKKKILNSLVIGLLLFQSLGLVWGGSFSSSVTIRNGGTKRYKGIRLTPGILSTANPYHSDLLLLNQSGEMVPYFINRYKEDQSQVSKTYEMKLINSYIKEPDFFYDYSLLDPVKGDLQATSIEITTNNDNFVKNVTTLGSYDNVNWETVNKDVIYSVDQTKKLAVSFDGIKKYTYYRFQINNPTEKINFQTVKLVFDQFRQKKEMFLETLTPSFAVKNIDKITEIVIENIKNLGSSLFHVGNIES